MPRVTRIVLFALCLALLPAFAQAQQICFSFASETNQDGPNWEGVAANVLLDGSAVDPSGQVEVRLLIQPGCDGGPVFTRDLVFVFQGSHFSYAQTLLTTWAHEWTLAGQYLFFNPVNGNVFLEVTFENALLTSWSPLRNAMGLTATLQSSYPVDAVVFSPGDELVALLEDSGYSTDPFEGGGQFGFTLTNIRTEDGVQFVPLLDSGDWDIAWLADGSYSAVVGFN